MIIEKITYRPLAGISLLLLFLLPTAAKDLHLWWEEHEHPACAAEAGERHLHDEEYAFHDCVLCLFIYPQFLRPALLKASEGEPFPQAREVFAFFPPPPNPGYFLVRKRGPPAS